MGEMFPSGSVATCEGDQTRVFVGLITLFLWNTHVRTRTGPNMADNALSYPSHESPGPRLRLTVCSVCMISVTVIPSKTAGESICNDNNIGE